jgi:hypothetical protein
MDDQHWLSFDEHRFSRKGVRRSLFTVHRRKRKSNGTGNGRLTDLALKPETKRQPSAFPTDN